MFDRRIIETKQQHVKLLIAKISIIGKIEEYKSKKKLMIRKIARKFINRFLNLSQPTNNFKFTLDQIRDPAGSFSESSIQNNRKEHLKRRLLFSSLLRNKIVTIVIDYLL